MSANRETPPLSPDPPGGEDVVRSAEPRDVDAMSHYDEASPLPSDPARREDIMSAGTQDRPADRVESS